MCVVVGKGTKIKQTEYTHLAEGKGKGKEKGE